MDPFEQAGYVSIVVWTGIYLPISCYGIHKLRRKHNQTCQSKRNLSMTFVVVSTCLFHICVERVLWILYAAGIYESKILELMSYSLYPIVSFAVMCALLWRFWIIHFDIHFVAVSANKKWRSIINNEAIEHDWYLQNRAKWGNRKFIGCNVLLPLYAFCAIMGITARWLIFSYSTRPAAWTSITYIGIALIPYSAIIYLWCKTPDFDDAYGIRAATKAIFIVLAIKFLTIIVVSICAETLIMNANENENQDEDLLILLLAKSHVIAFCDFMIILSLCFAKYIKPASALCFCPCDSRRTIVKQLDLFRAMTAHSSCVSDSEDVSKSCGSPRAALADPAKQKARTERAKLRAIQFKTISKRTRHFDAFMTHLGKEYSMEGLLAVVEFTQYQTYAIKEFKDYLSTKNVIGYTQEIVELPPDIPQSLIVYGPLKQKSKSPSSSRKKTMADIQCNNVEIQIELASPAPSSVSVTTSTSRTGSTLVKNGNTLTVDVTSTIRNRNGSGWNTPKHARSPQLSPGAMYRLPPCSEFRGLCADLRPFQTKASKLYEKYIAPGSDYEINISYGLRKAFTQMLGDDEVWSTLFKESGKNRDKLRNEKIIAERLDRILKLFAKCTKAMIKLTNQSFTRFKRAYAPNLKEYM